MDNKNKLPTILIESMKYLAHTFAISIRQPASNEEDLYHDLIVYYLENKNGTKPKKMIKKPEQEFKNYWYVRFKRYLLNKYTRAVVERTIIRGLKKIYYEDKSINRFKKTFNN